MGGKKESSIDALLRVEAERRAESRALGVRVAEHGTGVVWTDEIDISADTLWRLAQGRTGRPGRASVR